MSFAVTARGVGLQHGKHDRRGLRVGLAVVQGGPIVHLEGRQHIDGGAVQGASLRAGVAQTLQLLLEPGRVGRALGLQPCQVRGGAGFVVPAADARRGQLLPGEQRAGIDLALGRDIAVADHVPGRDAVALDDVAQQDGQRADLAVAVGMPLRFAVITVGPAGVDDLDADRRAVHGVQAVPGAFAGVPGGAGLIDQPVGAAGRIDQVMGADLALRQQLHRQRVVGRGVVQDHEAHPAALAGRGDGGVQVQARGAALGATGQGRQGQQYRCRSDHRQRARYRNRVGILSSCGPGCFFQSAMVRVTIHSSAVVSARATHSLVSPFRLASNVANMAALR